jgi:hypothetical protein
MRAVKAVKPDSRETPEALLGFAEEGPGSAGRVPGGVFLGGAEFPRGGIKALRRACRGLEELPPAGAVQGKGTSDKYGEALSFAVIQDLFP